MKTYKAFVVDELEANQFSGSVKELNRDDLPSGEILVRVKYSSLNYKDALSASGNKGVTKNYPHTPGIDAAGTVEKSSHPAYKTGDEVIVTSYDLGMNTPGGFGQYIRVPAAWLVKLPEGLTLKESMAFGTAGFTAGMAVYEIMKEVLPETGEILVTGASGGVGSLAIAILSKSGYDVVAVSGKPQAYEFLKLLGASKIISRQQALENNERPLLKPVYAGVVDTVGGEILANAIKSAKPNSVVAACGNVASPNLPINVFPFILRGVKLIGIDSQNCLLAHRKIIWGKLADGWKPKNLTQMVKIIGLDKLDVEIKNMLNGKITGRIVIELP